MDGNHVMMLKKKSLNLVLFPFVILNVVMENVEPLTFVPVRLVGKAHIVILVYLCQAVIMDIAKLPLNVFVRMDGMVLIVTSLTVTIANMDDALLPTNVYAMMVGLVTIAQNALPYPDAKMENVEVTPTPVNVMLNGKATYVTNPSVSLHVSTVNVWKRTELIFADANWDGKKRLVTNVCLIGNAPSKALELVKNLMNAFVPLASLILMASARSSSNVLTFAI